MTKPWWFWRAPENTEGEIIRIFYVYSLEDSPPHHVLMVQFKDGRNKRFSQIDKKAFKNQFDVIGLTAAAKQVESIPVQIPTPVQEKKECSIM